MGLAGALGVGTLGNLIAGAGRPTHAAPGDYKALVCVFLYGGNDGLNTIVPTDAPRYSLYQSVRGDMAVPNASLSRLPGINFGLHPSMAALAPAAAAGQLAPVFNLGTLNRPLTKAQFRAEPSSSDLLPDNLFSHSDQQTLWETGSSSVLTRSGWGGRASEALATANPVISVSGSARFGVSDTQSPLVLPDTPGETFGAYGLQPDDLRYAPNAARKAALTALYAEPQEVALGNAFSTAQRNAFVVSDRLGALVKVTPGGTGASAAIDTAFAPLIRTDKTLATGLARQLYQVAKLIAGNATVQGTQQIFFTEMGGFDTHAGQTISGSPTEGAHARLLKELADALACFHAAMNMLGLGESVTAFTQSDFGRTFLTNNSTGTDHAWGNQHLVIGGAVKGGASYGTYPDLTLGGPDDVGVETWERQGRYLPTTSVDQYAATLLGWFGATDTQLNNVLPNLRNFTTKKLGFL
jgi:uncharacterized protein (DUF1501 family)